MEGIFHPEGLAMKLMNWLTDMCQIQLLWLFYSLRGGVILGLFPATRAMFSVQRKLIIKKRTFSLTREFKRDYHQHFKKANQMGYLMLVIGTGLVFYLRSTLILKINLAAYFVGLAYALIAFFVLLNLYTLVMLSHLELDEGRVLKQARMVMLLSPVHSFLMLLTIFAFLFLIRTLPVLAPVILVAVFSYFVSYVALHAINQIICRYQ